MQKPNELMGSSTMIKIGVYHKGMLTACDETQTIGTEFELVLGSVKSTYSARREASELVTLCLARRNYADRLLDRDMKKVDASMLAEVNKNRNHPKYKKLLPSGLSAVIYAPLAEELAVVRTFIKGLPGEFPELSQIYVPKLEVDCTRVETSIKELKDALQQEADAMAAEKAARIDFSIQYEKNYGKLIDMFPGERSFVESFFMKFRSSGSGDDNDAEAEASPGEEQITTS